MGFAARLLRNAPDAAMATAPDLPAHLAERENFRAAARHSRRVRFLRRAIPWACLATVLFLAIRSVASLLIGPDGAIGSGFRIEGRKIVMDKPRLSGFKKDGSSYEMTAESAIQDLKTPNVVELQKLRARMQAGAEGWANLAGDTGRYDSTAERLIVQGNVTVKTESGTEAYLQDADIEFKTGRVISEKRADVRTAQGNVLADRVEVLDNGKRLVFEGNVSSQFTNPGTAP